MKTIKLTKDQATSLRRLLGAELDCYPNVTARSTNFNEVFKKLTGFSHPNYLRRLKAAEDKKKEGKY